MTLNIKTTKMIININRRKSHVFYDTVPLAKIRKINLNNQLNKQDQEDILKVKKKRHQLIIKTIRKLTYPKIDNQMLILNKTIRQDETIIRKIQTTCHVSYFRSNLIFVFILIHQNIQLFPRPRLFPKQGYLPLLLLSLQHHL